METCKAALDVELVVIDVEVVEVDAVEVVDSKCSRNRSCSRCIRSTCSRNRSSRCRYFKCSRWSRSNRCSVVDVELCIIEVKVVEVVNINVM